MKLLVIGGSGFVSGTLVQKALGLGHEVWTVTRGRKPVAEGAQLIRTDRRDRGGFSHAVRSVGTHWDLTVDCIGFDEDDARQDIEVLLPLSGSFVFISTDFVYSPTVRETPQPEDAVSFRTDGYGGKKRDAEQLIESNTSYTQWTILRPCHIYGPGSLLGCLPEHSRDPDLISRIKNGEQLSLVGGGAFLQQPLYCGDLVDVILSAVERDSARGVICNVSGPDVIHSHDYYRIIGEILNKEVRIAPVSTAEYLAQHPERDSFLCDRVYDTHTLKSCGLAVPSTKIEEGLRLHVQSLLQ
jgi:nucleoside-diphosphate-sugar epimerase